MHRSFRIVSHYHQVQAVAGLRHVRARALHCSRTCCWTVEPAGDPHAPAQSPTLHEMRELLREAGGSGTVHLDLGSSYHPNVAVLTVDNPAKANAVSCKMMAEFADHIDTLRGWRDGRALILVGGGKTFCSGADLSSHPEFFTQAFGRSMCAVMTHVTGALRRLPFVSIAAVHGAAVGGGSELAVSTNACVMAEGSYIQFVHTTRGLLPGWGGLVPLVDTVGARAATKLLMLAPRISATQAQRMGLCDEIVPVPDKPVRVRAPAQHKDEQMEGASMVDRVVSILKTHTELLSEHGATTPPDVVAGLHASIDGIIGAKTERQAAAVCQHEFLGLWGGASHMDFLKKFESRRKRS